MRIGFMKALVFYIFLMMVFTACSQQEKNSSEKPNFIILQADDLGYDDLALNGNTYVQTPNLDKLANQSVVINNFYVNPVCAPTRASLLTGRDFLLTGVSHVHGGKDFISLNEKTFADIFRNHGYATGIWGKWHSGKTEGYFPWQRGFDEAYMAQLYKHRNSAGLLNGKAVSHTKWSDEVIVDYAINFIESNKQKPFIAYLSFLSCHAPIVAIEEVIEKYVKMGLSRNLAAVYAMIDQMDHEIGRLLSYLENSGIYENTLILFMSDNGPAILNNWLSDNDRNVRYHGKFKGHKGNIWENGVKSPLIVSWPEKLNPRTSGLLCDVSDIFPTMAEFADIELSAYALELSGKSFADHLLKNRDARPDKMVFNYANKGWPPTDLAWTPKGVKNEYLPNKDKGTDPELQFSNQILSMRTEDYKILKNASSRENNILDAEGYALINIKNDPGEKYNLSKEKSGIYSQMKDALETRYCRILRSENSYQPIIFRILPYKPNSILLYAPSKMSEGVKIAFDFSWPWNSTGLWAEYQIDCTDTITVLPLIPCEDCDYNPDLMLKINGLSSSVEKVINDTIFFEAIEISTGRHNLLLQTGARNLPEKEIHLRELIMVSH